MRRWWIVVFLFTLAMINYTDRIALSVAAKPIAEEFGLSPVEMGYVFSSFLWTYLVCLLPVGVIVDRIGAKRTNGSGIALWSLATIATGFSGGLASLVATRLAMGVGEATTYPAGARVIRQWIPARDRGVVNAIFNNGAYAGPAFGAILVGYLVTGFGWRTAFVVVGLVGFVWLLAWQIWYGPPEKTTWLSPRERDFIVATRDGAPAPVAARSSARYLDLLRFRSQWGIMLTQSSMVYTQYLFLTWLPGYLQQTKGITVLSAGLYTALPYGVAMLLSTGLSLASDRFGETRAPQDRRRLVIVAGLLVSSVILLAPLVDSIWMIVGLISLTLTALSTAGAMNWALVNDLVTDARDVGKSMSLVIVSGNVFGLLAPIVTGHIVGFTGSFSWAFIVAGLFLLLGSAFTLVLTGPPIATASGSLAEGGPR